MIRKNKLLIIAVGVLIAGLILGFIAGMAYGIKLTIKNALEVLPYFVNITINEKEINQALFQYRNYIGGCHVVNNITI